MKSSRFTSEHIVYLALFFLALGFRLIGLGSIPLSDHEAAFALPALQASKGLGASFLSQPGYISLTSLLFFLFGSSDWLARLIPALAGSLMVYVPFLFRSKLGRRSGIALAVLLAIDPGLLAFSHTADGTTLTLAFSLLAAGLLFNGQMVAAGICAGLALLGGPLLWPGLIVGGLAYWLSRGAFHTEQPGLETPADEVDRGTFLQRTFGGARTRFWLSLGITTLMISTQFLLVPGGLNAVANGLVDYLRSWGDGFRAPTLQSLLLFFAYEPVFLLPALFRGITAWFSRDELDKFLIRWMALAILLSLINPGQTFSSSAWVLIPMLALAARQIAAVIPERIQFKAASGVLGFIVFSVVIFMIMTIVSLASGQVSPENLTKMLIALAATPVILILSTYLIGTGWTWEASLPGIKTAIFVLLGISVLGAGWHAAGLGRQPEREMWRAGQTVISNDLLKTTVGDISEYNTGRRDDIDVRLIGIQSPALDWALRTFENTAHINAVTADENSSILLTPADEVPALGDKYRGQKIVWASRPAWDLFSLEEWPTWLIFRQGPMDDSQLMIWVRADLFPGSQGSQKAASPTK
jgi:hypothetical protein